MNVQEILQKGEIGGFGSGNAGDMAGDGDGSEGECPAGEYDSVSNAGNMGGGGDGSEGECPAGEYHSVSMAKGRQESSWLFGLEMTAQVCQ